MQCHNMFCEAYVIQSDPENMNIIPVVISDKVIYKLKIISLMSLLCIASRWGHILRILYRHMSGVVWEQSKNYLKLAALGRWFECSTSSCRQIIHAYNFVYFGTYTLTVWRTLLLFFIVEERG